MTDEEKKNTPGYDWVEESEYHQEDEYEEASSCSEYWNLLDQGFSLLTISNDPVEESLPVQMWRALTYTLPGFYHWNPSDPTQPDPDENEEWRDTSPAIVSTSGTGTESSEFRVMGEGSKVKVLVITRQRDVPSTPPTTYNGPCPWHMPTCPNCPSPPSTPQPSPSPSAQWSVIDTRLDEYSMQHVFTETLQGAEGKEKQIVIIPIRLISASLAGGDLFHVTNDAGSTTYAAPHWADLNGNAQADASPTDKVSPVAFKATVQPKLTAAYALGAAVPTDLTLTMKTTSSNGFAIPQTVVPGGMGEQTLPDTTVTGSFPAIDYFNAPDNEVIWQVGAGGDFKDFGKSQMTVYVVGENPQTDHRYESTSFIGCKEARGLASGEPVATAIYAKFKSREVQKTQERHAQADGSALKYDHPAGIETQPLLTSGKGQCGGWAKFFTDCIRVQGANASVIKVAPPDFNLPNINFCAYFRFPLHEFAVPTNWRPALIVKNWSAALPKLGFLDPIADELSGVEGQNHPNPQSLFYDHAIVVAFGKIYDPSYGTPECNSYASWEEMSLEGYGGMVRILDPLGGNSGDYLWVQPSIQHGTFSDSGY